MIKKEKKNVEKFKIKKCDNEKKKEKKKNVTMRKKRKKKKKGKNQKKIIKKTLSDQSTLIDCSKQSENDADSGSDWIDEGVETRKKGRERCEKISDVAIEQTTILGEQSCVRMVQSSCLEFTRHRQASRERHQVGDRVELDWVVKMF
ncbi:hypothetical protein RFI_25364 [Reticulomyxa filosa]|uniref:Uncharacterized protein n=1 Tax=Reticulomyxa filosa TaxID=46433 RepID=X6MF26_RETFI|nr:hypothetical protein RFI_25364 [Reticulomyxa filosa]|eukprot:ETO12012.1 hypothetical protein RFI_25364 [Reticulomyxa filosa]